MVVKRCSYGVCRSDSRYRGKNYMDGVFFIRFPQPKTQLEKCRRWVNACCRADNFGINRISRSTYVCSLHFAGGNGPTDCHPDPIPATARGVELSIFEKNKVRKQPTDRSAITPVEKRRRTLPLSDQCHGFPGKSKDENTLVTACGNTLREKNNANDTCNSVKDKLCSQTAIKTCTVGTQTSLTLNHIGQYSEEALKDNKCMRRELFMSDVTKDDQTCKFYTGLGSIQILMYIFNVVKTKAEHLTLWRGENRINVEQRRKCDGRVLNTFQAFILTLVRLRRGLDVEQLSDTFGISVGSVSRYCFTWVEFLSKELSFLISWPSRDQIRSTLPRAFRYFKNTSAIIDCTEFFVQKPSIPSSQRITWSAYKHHNTLKTLISISPTGAFTFVSDLWSGSVSDRGLVQRCGFLEHIRQGDDVMADRGFLIRDLLALRGATLNIPPFTHGKQLCSAAVTKTRRIASARIHVERAIGRLKNFKILQGIFPLKSKDTINQIVQLCAQLCNLDNSLVR